MVKGPTLTARDYQLLYDCYSHIMLSFDQIGRRHFPGAKPPTVCNRLTKLVRAGFLAKTRVAVVLGGPRQKSIGIVYQVTKKALRVLEPMHPQEAFTDEIPRVSPHALTHDLLLTEAMTALRRHMPGRRIIHGKLACLPTSRGERQPDALIERTEGRGCIAIELELTAKSERRYREIILQYRLASKYQAVLYITASRSIADKITAQITGYKAAPGKPRLPTGKFHFITLDRLLCDTSQTAISSEDTVFFENIAA